MGGRGGTSGLKGKARLFEEVNTSSPRTIVISGTVWLHDGIHMPETHRQKELSNLLKRPDFTDFVLKTNNDKRGSKIVEEISKMGFEVKKRFMQGENEPPYVKNLYYMKRKKK